MERAKEGQAFATRRELTQRAKEGPAFEVQECKDSRFATGAHATAKAKKRRMRSAADLRAAGRLVERAEFGGRCSPVEA
jgi:hypothetical protein